MIHHGMVECTVYDRWAVYYRYFYFHHEMTFEQFIRRVEAGWVPKRGHIDWSKVGGHLDNEEEALQCTESVTTVELL